MPNNNYRKGYNKELKIVNEFRLKGCLAFRSAGSHSPIDVCIINNKSKTIKLIQSKTGYLSVAKRKEILDEGQKLNGDYKVDFELWG